MSNRKVSESSSSGSSDDEVDNTLANETVVAKYGFAADIVNSVLKEVIANIQEGVEVSFLCDLGDRLINEKAGRSYKKEKSIQKGIAMPTCISIDNCICHYSPLRSDAPVKLEKGQLVKVDLGAHVDGFIATAAHSVVVGATKDSKVQGVKADLIKATYDAMEVAIRCLRPGTKNTEVTTFIDRVAEQYGVKPIENMVSHQLEKNKIDGEKQIIQNPGEKQKGEIEKVTIEEHEAYAIDVLFSTGEGKAKDMDTRTTVFKKADDVVYQLKMKASRVFCSEAMSKYGNMPFSLRSFDDEVKAKMGVVECERHGLMKPYQVLYEREGDLVCQFKCTVLVMPNGVTKIAGLALDHTALECSKRIEDKELFAKLNSALKIKKKPSPPANKEEETKEKKDEKKEEKKETKKETKKEAKK